MAAKKQEAIMSNNTSDIAIKVENLGKKYVINHEKGNGDDNFREVLIGAMKKIITSLNPFSKSIKQESTTEDFWALNDVNFTINRGDKVGIIGRNGAGKSTLLKVLSRITEPTTGKIHINGRIASLLEVGTGFHPELTGRENIYLNGAILGMNRKEIKAKFDEIVAFAEVDKFLDTPVKRYSSGMYVRLAFSVAAHLEPEILVIDEVLAVGDVEFQKKCLGKMGEVSKEGRTILFVSHNMNAIEQLCNKGILLSQGKCKYFDSIAKAIDSYESLQPNLFDSNLDVCRIDKSLSKTIEFKKLYFSGTNRFESCKNIEFYIEAFSKENVDKFRVSLTVFSISNISVGSTFSLDSIAIREKELKRISVKITNHNLAPGKYYLGVSLGQGNNKKRNIDFDIVNNVLPFDVISCSDTKGYLPQWVENWGNIMFEELQITESNKEIN